MIHEEIIALSKGSAQGFVAPLGPVSLVWAVAAHGFIGCGAFDVMALDRFGLAAARVRGVEGRPIASVADLLEGEVREANAAAVQRGVRVGMRGREALEALAE